MPFCLISVAFSRTRTCTRACSAFPLRHTRCGFLPLRPGPLRPCSLPSAQGQLAYRRALLVVNSFRCYFLALPSACCCPFQAMFVDFGMAKQYGGVCYLRYDDTNPEAEKMEYITHIQEIAR